MTKPATDEEIEQIEAYALECGGLDDVLSLIARIRSEQEEKVEALSEVNRIHHEKVDHFEARLAAEALASSIREKTIRECAEVITMYMVASRTDAEFLGYDQARDAILALLEQKP